MNPGIDPEILKTNRRKLSTRLPDDSLVVFFASQPKIRSGDAVYPYCQDKNFVYFTGYEYPDSAVILYKSKSQLEERFFLKIISNEQAHWFGRRPDIENAKEITGIPSCQSDETFLDTLGSYLKKCKVCYLDYDPSFSDISNTSILNFTHRIRDRFPHITIQRIAPIMASIRQVKEPWEIERIKQAIEITRKGIHSILRHARQNMREFEVEAFFNFELHSHGCQPAFQSIIASGSNATTLHYVSNSSLLINEQLCLIDVGAEFGYYSADISRTFPVSGKFTSFQRDLYNIVLAANERVIQTASPGKTLNELNECASKILAEGLLDLKIIEKRDQISGYFTHHVSHMLGLYTHDVITDIDEKLVPNMVLTIEPGLYLADKKVGIRIEDDVVITESGCINLSESIPKTPEDIEALMMK